MRAEIDNVSKINDIAKIQDYIVGNELVNEYGLALDIISLYKKILGKMIWRGSNDHIEDLINVAYNRTVHMLKLILCWNL